MLGLIILLLPSAQPARLNPETDAVDRWFPTNKWSPQSQVHVRQGSVSVL